MTALLLAIKNKHESVVKYLIENDVDLHHHEGTGNKRTPLMMAGELNSVNCLRELLDSMTCFDVNKPNPMGITALSWSSMCGSTDAVTMLLEAGADTNCTDAWGECALIRACGTDKPEVVKILLDFGADPNLADGGGRTPLARSVRGLCSEMIREAGGEE